MGDNWRNMDRITVKQLVPTKVKVKKMVKTRNND